MNDSDLIQWSRNIESKLKIDYGAHGRGLGKLVDSIHGKIPYTLESEIMFFA